MYGMGNRSSKNTSGVNRVGNSITRGMGTVGAGHTVMMGTEVASLPIVTVVLVRTDEVTRATLIITGVETGGLTMMTTGTTAAAGGTVGVIRGGERETTKEIRFYRNRTRIIVISFLFIILTISQATQPWM